MIFCLGEWFIFCVHARGSESLLSADQRRLQPPPRSDSLASSSRSTATTSPTTQLRSTSTLLVSSNSLCTAITAAIRRCGHTSLSEVRDARNQDLTARLRCPGLGLFNSLFSLILSLGHFKLNMFSKCTAGRGPRRSVSGAHRSAFFQWVSSSRSPVPFCGELAPEGSSRSLLSRQYTLHG
mgnify:FL=1